MNLYYFELLNPVAKPQGGTGVLMPAEGFAEAKARQRILDEADQHADALQYRRGERLGRVVEAFRPM